ncbi:hypothetical protein ISF6_3622 [Piscinibacter sakaiensis]|uniref:Uncharacterized protein n=1 Tax=Piscinibacter sakaiensis TaxID=1547922 RepID=A0A0K8P4U4_PISS1|nr:hypothetical protein ISF6_3622 [Piscinibacter sakaiensis]
MTVLSARGLAPNHSSDCLEPPSWREAGGSRRTRWSPLPEGARGSRA